MENERLLVVLTTAPSREAADAIAAAVLEKHLAACVSIVPGVRSRYWWKGALETAEELLLLIKTPVSRYSAIQCAILAAHPYDTPEIVALEPSQVLDAYRLWVLAETNES